MIRDALARSAEELQQRVNEHRRLLEQAAKEDGGAFEGCPLLDCPHRRKLRTMLVEVIEILEQTRRAFKSKQLETLRKKLLSVLAECE
jgi:hypothetical protein